MSAILMNFGSLKDYTQTINKKGCNFKERGLNSLSNEINEKLYRDTMSLYTLNKWIEHDKLVDGKLKQQLQGRIYKLNK